MPVASRLIATTIAAGFASLFAPRIDAADLIAPGIQPKAAAGAGQTVTRGAAAIFFNPANLIFVKHVEPTLDISFAKVTYTYIHSDIDLAPDPVVVNVIAPPVTAGLAIRLVPNFSLGVAVVPTGTGEARAVKNVPLFIPGLNVYPDPGKLVDVNMSESGFKIAAGAALRLDDAFILGAGVLYHMDKFKQYQVGLPGEEPFLDIKNQGNFTQFIGGVRSEVFDRRVALGLSVKLPVQKKYKGDYIFDLSQGKKPAETVPTETLEYLPMTIGLGIESRLESIGFFVDIVREQWSKGREIVRRGLDSDPFEVDLKDTNNICAGIKIWPSTEHMLTASFGRYGANIGDGSKIPEAGAAGSTSDDRIGGMTFGNLEGISRTVFAGGYRMRIAGRGYFEMVGQYQSGSRIVPEGFEQEGYHAIKVLMASAGFGYGF